MPGRCYYNPADVFKTKNLSLILYNASNNTVAFYMSHHLAIMEAFIGGLSDRAMNLEKDR